VVQASRLREMQPRRPHHKKFCKGSGAISRQNSLERGEPSGEQAVFQWLYCGPSDEAPSSLLDGVRVA
jgi:hypothetical protein